MLSFKINNYQHKKILDRTIIKKIKITEQNLMIIKNV